MGQYKFMIDWTFNTLGASITYNKGYDFRIMVLCIQFYWGLTDTAHGVMFFGKEQ